MVHPLLDVFHRMAGVHFVPTTVQILGRPPELDDQIAGQVLWLDLTALLAPETKESSFIMVHDYAGVRAADEGASTFWSVHLLYQWGHLVTLPVDVFHRTAT